MAKFKIVYDATSGEGDEIKSFLHASEALVSTSGALHVNLQNTSIAVTATDLDIRDLAFATDSVDVSGSEVELGATTLAALENISAVVTATDLDIRDLAFATDSVDVSGSEVELGATTLAALENITVSATDLDIRDLAFATDSVDVSGSSVSITGTVATSVATPTVFRTLSKAVTTSGLLFAANAGQKEVLVQNNGNKAIAVGPSGVTFSGTPATDGILVAAGDEKWIEVSNGTALHAVSKDGSSQNVRVGILEA